MSRRVKVSIAVWLIFGAGWFLWQRREATPLDAIVVADGAVMVRNQSSRDWHSVRIWVNDVLAQEPDATPVRVTWGTPFWH